MGQDYSFPPANRLRNSSEFRSVFDQCKYRLSSPELLMLVIPNELEIGRLGMVISKKSLPKAHQRNRIKRLIRESFRLNQNELCGFDIVVLSRRLVAKIDNEGVYSIIGNLWKELIAKDKN